MGRQHHEMHRPRVQQDSRQGRTGKNGEKKPNWLQSHLWCPLTVTIKALEEMITHTYMGHSLKRGWG